MCCENGCRKSSAFNIEGETKRLYCAEHKKEGMVNIGSKKCCEEGCKKQPAFNERGGTNALYCAQHKKEGMINVVSKMCYEEGCLTRPVFNVDGKIKALYCYKHKKEGMIDVISKRCIEKGCKTRPSFNIEGNSVCIYCYKHKKEGMVDVKSKLCQNEGCNKYSLFNYEGETKKLYCSNHKKYGMINVGCKPCCEKGCKKTPVFNTEGTTTRLYCAEHKKQEMVDIKNKTCKTYLCNTRVREKYEGYCLFCYIHLFPDKPVSRNYKTKECSTIQYVKQQYPELSWKSDKIIQDGCSKRRPDLLLDLGYQIIIIEIDENQHIDYNCSCENKRIMELSQDLQHRPIIFIRFNPDKYENNGTIITSCWGTDKKGICIIKNKKKEEWKSRLDILHMHIEYWLQPQNKTNKTIEVINLFYDI